MIGAFRTLTVNKSFDEVNERSWIEQSRRQNYEAFGKIVDAYQSRLLGFVKRMVRDQEDAQDITQETFIRAFQAMDTFDGRSTLKTWLFRIAYNLSVDRMRKRGRTPTELSIEPSDPSIESGLEFADQRWNPQEICLQEELQNVLDKAIDSMSEKLRTVLLLHDVEDLGYEEIAATVQIPVGTVKSRLFLARAHIKNSIEMYQNGEIA